MAKSSPNPRDPKLPLGTDKCRCTACNLYFNSSYAFSKHRYGEYSADPSTRHCLTAAELEAAGWTLSSTGHYRSPSRAGGFAMRRRQAGPPQGT